MRKARFGVFQYLAQKRAARNKDANKNRQYQDYLYKHQEKFKEQLKNNKDSHILRYSDVPYMAYCFGICLFLLGLYIDYIAFHGEFQTIWSQLHQEYVIEFMAGTCFIYTGFGIIVILEVEKLKIDKKNKIIVVSRWRLFQKSVKSYYNLEKLDYFQIWKSGYISRQNNNMRYKMMFIFGKQKVKVMTKVQIIEIKKIYVEIKTFLDQEFNARDLKIIDSQKAEEGINSYGNTYTDNGTTLNVAN